VSDAPTARSPSTGPDCLLVEGCDFESFPPGGQLHACRQLAAAFGPRLGLVGISTGAVPVGRWVERELGGRRFHYFAAARRDPSARRPWVPARLSFHVGLRRHRAAILSLGVRAAFVHAPETLLAVADWGLDGLCVQLHGVENPLARSRYRWARPLAPFVDRRFFAALGRADVVLASADEAAVSALVRRSGGLLPRQRVRLFPTRFDPALFHPGPMEEARVKVGAGEGPLVVVSGRLNREKGWDLVLDGFALLARRQAGARLVFVGDGEDRPALEAAIRSAGLEGAVRITGFLSPGHVADWLRAADAVAVGSHREGWSIAVLEALACGKPVVSTDVSGARALVRDGENGFVLSGREPAAFASALERAMALPDPASASLALVAPYDMRGLARDVGAAWEVLA